MTDEPTPQALDLDALEAVALAADRGGRRWFIREGEVGGPGVGGYPQTILREGDVVLVAECYEGQETYPATFAPFIVAFDPPTVLALINLARSASRTATEGLPHADVSGLTPETCPQRGNHGSPFRYCPVKGCGWHEGMQR